ncbi:CRISPR-associated protein Csx20 [Jiulongibacter sediminis]|uniref:CRISPR-associated protein Csx20 n=1 Tax=Jiulongibacter sediminis TaxID=1605367 RepID=UPI0026EFCB4A|nr:CRISPR-associated protein Csx20 [Jiulongibacter sediminis]
MSKKVLNLTNHSVTVEQEYELKTKWEVSEIINLPDNLKKTFGNVPPEFESLQNFCQPFIRWIEENFRPDILLWIQGEPGFIFILVSYFKRKGYRVIHATTVRQVIENGPEKRSIFSHSRFREYELIDISEES